MAGLFQVLYGQPNGKFRKAEPLKGTDGEPLIIPGSDEDDELIQKICTRPFAVDWDGDKHLDLVVGNYSGTFYWFRGEGQGKFQPKPELIKVGKDPLTVDGHHSDPFVIDWDGDGDLDLLSGSDSGGVQWSENTAAAGKLPQLRKFKSLIKPGSPSRTGNQISEDALTGPTESMRVWVADMNKDGKLDLLVGDCVTVTAPLKARSREEFRKQYAEWKKAYDKLTRGGSSEDGEDEQAKTREERDKIYERRSEFEDDTGFVWMYLQK